MRFLIIFLLLPFYVSSQVYYEGFSPYILGHKQDTTNAILVDNTEDGFVGYYIVKQGDTVKFHLDTANLLLLHTDTSFRIEFDSLYLDTLVYGRGKYLLTWDDVTKQVFALDTLSFSDSLYFLFSSDNSPTGWYYSGDTVEIDTTDTGGADSLYFWYTDTIGVTDWYFPGDTILIDTSGSTILYDTLVDGFGIKYFRYTPSVRDTVEADSLDLDDWFVTDTLFSYTVDSIFTYVNDSLYSYLYDTLYISLSDTMFSYFYDTLYNTLYDSLFVNISDSLFVYFYDSVYNTLYDSLYIYLYDSLFISVTDSIYSYFYDSLYVTLYDSLYIHLYDSLYIYLYDSLFISVTDSIYSYFYDSLFISLTDSLIIYINDSLGGIDSTYVEFTDYHSLDGWYGTGDSLRIDTTDMIGDTSLWEITVGDTIDTKGFNIRLDSSFAMVYNNDYFGYDPEKTKTKTIYNQIKWGDTVMYHVMQATPGSFIHNLFTGEPTSTNGGLNMGWYPGITDTMIEVLLYSTDNFVVSAIYVTPQRIRLLTDDTIVLEADRGVYLRLKRLSNPNAPFVIDTLPQSSKQFLMSWDSASGQVYVIDTTGWKGGSEDSLYFLKSDSWFDNGWYRNDTIQVDTGYWTLNGNHLYPNNTTDSVIIGGTSPGEILEVTGNMRFSDGANRKVYVEKSTVLGADGYNLEIYAGNSNDPGESGTGKGGDVIIHGGTGDGGGSPAGGNVFIYPINQDQDGSLFLNLDTDTLSSDTRIYLGGVYTKDNATDSVLVLSRDHTLSWLSKDSLMSNAGDSCLWEITSGDTIDTKDFNILLDSSFNVVYDNGGVKHYIGMDDNFFGEPNENVYMSLNNSNLDSSGIIRVVNDQGILVKMGAYNGLRSDVIVLNGRSYEGDIQIAHSGDHAPNIILSDDGLELSSDDGMPIYLNTDTLLFDSPPIDTAAYFLMWNNYTKEIVAMDTIGWGGGGIGTSYWTYVDAATDTLYNNQPPSGTGVIFLKNDVFTDRWLNNGSNTIFGIESMGNDGLIHTTGTTGLNNTAIGSYSLWSCTKGYSNTAIGASALVLDTTGFHNVAIGESAMYKNRSGSYNISIGSRPLYNQTTGSYNTAIGYWAGYTLTTQSSNIYIGANSGIYSTSNQNVSIGVSALYKSSGDGNVAIGYESIGDGEGTSSYNTAVGINSLNELTDGDYNIAIGPNSLGATTTGEKNTSIGYNSGLSLTGDNNVIIGFNVAELDTTGYNNVYIGYESGYSGEGHDNIFIGYQSGYSETGSEKLYIENSNSATPLIGGDFAADRVTINTILNLATVTDLTVSPLEGDIQLHNDTLKIYIGGAWKKFQLN